MTFLFLFGGGLIVTLMVVLFIFLFPLLALISALFPDWSGSANQPLVRVSLISLIFPHDQKKMLDQ